MRATLFGLLLLMFQNTVSAGEWCSISPGGYTISENRDTVTVEGTLVGASGSAYKGWLVLDSVHDPDAGKKRLGLILAAAAMGKSLSLYIADPYTCVTVPHWQRDVVWHLQVR